MPGIVVQDPAIAHHQAAPRKCKNLAEGRHTVL
jgi:hypothetical protein